MAEQLDHLADAVRAVPGNLGFELLRNLDDGDRFVFIEKWESVDAHKAAGQHVPREAFAMFGELLDNAMDGAYLSYLKTI